MGGGGGINSYNEQNWEECKDNGTMTMRMREHLYFSIQNIPHK